MTEEPRGGVDAALTVMVNHLEPVIRGRLASHLKGLEWTVILSELDKIKGYPPKTYSVVDPQVQLRVITERLGGLGYPFDDQSRVVSTLGGELRIVRNTWAHHDELTWIDALRAADYVRRLLEHFDANDGASAAKALWAELLPRVARDEGIALADAAKAPSASAVPALETGERETTDDDKSVDLGDGVLTRDVAEETPSGLDGVGITREPFQAWPGVVAGEQSVIADLPKKAAKMKVRAVAAEIADFEGPIHIERLARRCAAAFKFGRLSKQRIKQLSYQIGVTEGLTVDKYGFVWPAGLDPDSWREFRPQSDASSRTFEEVSPHEIANASRFIERRLGRDNEEAFQHSVAAVFGRSKITKSAAAHLAFAEAIVRSSTT